MDREKHILYSLLKIFWLAPLCLLFSNCEDRMNVQSSVEEGTLDVPVRDAALLELEQARSFYEKKDTLSSQTRSFFADSVDGNFLPLLC